MKKIALLTLLSTIPSSNEFLNRCMPVPKNPLRIYSQPPKDALGDNRKKNLLKLNTELLREKTNDVFNSDCDALKKLIPAKANFWCRLDYHQMDITHKAFESDSEPLKKLITDNVHRWHTLDSHTMFMIKDAYTSGHAIDIKWKSN